MTLSTIHDELRANATGEPRLEALAEMLIRAFNGRFAAPGWAWIIGPIGDRRIDPHLITDNETTCLSNSEHHFLRIAAAIGTDSPISINPDQATDHHLTDLILAAIAHRLGRNTTTQTLTTNENGEITIVTNTPLHPWPEGGGSNRTATTNKPLNQ